MSPKARVTDPNNLALQKIAPLIHEIRAERVILDSHLAAVYGIETRSLVQAIKRNADRFPDDFAFRLSKSEYDGLRSQFVISKTRGGALRHQFGTSSSHGGRRYLPYVFTEHGAIMAANVLNSKQAVLMSVALSPYPRAFLLSRSSRPFAK